jgi:hypothetical protein
MVRWESAPVRAAELKAGVERSGDGRRLLRGRGLLHPRSPPLESASELEGVAYLKRYRKKDLEPACVEFVARIDRRFLEQFFNVNEMGLIGQTRAKNRINRLLC